MEKQFKFQFKNSRAKNSPLREFTGTWQEMEMYYPGTIVVTVTPVEEQELELV